MHDIFYLSLVKQSKYKHTLIFTCIVLLLELLFFSVLHHYSSVNLFTHHSFSKTSRYPSVYRENFSDTASVGILTKKNDHFLFQYTKSSKIKRPFTAVFFPIEELELNLSQYNKIEFDIIFDKAQRVPVNLSLHYDDYHVRYITEFIEVKKGIQQYTLDISNFKTPPEWYEANKLSLNDLPEITLKNARTISIESCHLLAPTIQDSYQINSITLHRNLTGYQITLILIGVFSLFLWSVFYLNIFQKKAEKIVHIPIVPTKDQMSDNEFDKISLYISEHYKDPTLTVKMVAKTLGYSNAKISQVLKEETQLSFPQYLSMIRITEAKRIFQTGDFSTISDVAYLIGFNRPNNFSRVFKSLEGCTPKEFIDTNPS